MLSFYKSDDKSIQELEDFYNQNVNWSIFGSFAFQKIYSLSAGHTPFSFYVRDEKDIVGLINGAILKNYFWPLSFFTKRAIIIDGPFIRDNNPEVTDFLLKNFTNWINNKAIYTQFRNLRPFSEIEKSIFEKLGYKYERHLDIIHHLNIPLKEQFEKVHKGRRKNIGRAVRCGMKFEMVTTQKEFWEAYSLVKNNYLKLGLPLPHKSFFRMAYNHLFTTSNLIIFAAFLDKKMVSARMVLCYNRTLYDWYAGTSSRFLDCYPNDFLPWKIIEWGTNNNYDIFDFGGAGKPEKAYGVRDHKLKFGGEVVEYGRFERVNNPKFMKFGIFLYKLLKKLK